MIRRTKKVTNNLDILKSFVLDCQLKRKKNAKLCNELLMDYMKDTIRDEYFSYTQEELNPVIESTWLYWPKYRNLLWHEANQNSSIQR